MTHWNLETHQIQINKFSKLQWCSQRYNTGHSGRWRTVRVRTLDRVSGRNTEMALCAQVTLELSDENRSWTQEQRRSRLLGDISQWTSSILAPDTQLSISGREGWPSGSPFPVPWSSKEWAACVLLRETDTCKWTKELSGLLPTMAVEQTSCG